MKRVAVLIYDDVCVFSYAVAYKVFGFSWPTVPRFCKYATVSMDGPVVTTADGLSLTASAGLEALAEQDIVIIPGWRDVEERAPASVLSALRRAHEAGACLASDCLGAFVLADAGLLDGRRATTHWAAADLLAGRFPEIDVLVRDTFVGEDRLYTSAGVVAGLDLCIHLVERHFGPHLARQVAKYTCMSAVRFGSQAQFVEPPQVAEGQDGIAQTLAMIAEDPAQPHTVEGLAARAKMSKRTFCRHFQARTGASPHQWILARRLDRAKALLAERGYAIAQIADLAGFNTVAAFYTHFKRHVGMTPKGFRDSALRYASEEAAQRQRKRPGQPDITGAADC